MDVGQRLRQWRTKVGISQKVAAEQIGTDQRVWASWEAGTTPEVDYTEAIERLTKGAVTIRDWVRERRKKRRAANEQTRASATVDSGDEVAHARAS
jgi:transcriptional regulator with XRE-family HTH domain